LRQKIIDHLLEIGFGFSLRDRHEVVRSAKTDHGKPLARMRDGARGNIG
jgi:hypothetical protein